jgi:hypothetical protein
MKNTLVKGVAIALIHIAIVLSLGGKLLYDRRHCPRVWVATGSFDPDMPIRGRYIAVRLRVQAPWFTPGQTYQREDVRLSVENNQLVASKSDVPTGVSLAPWQRGAGTDSWFLNEPVAFFLPEHAQVPFPPKVGAELWAEVTVPRKGPPRPIQLAIKRGTEWQPLNLR